MYKGNYLIAIALLSISTNVFAYLDPGTGSVIVQAVISAVSLGIGAIAFYWQRFIALFKKKKPQEVEKEQNKDKPL